MMPYKDIGDNLTIDELNGVVSLLRDNVNFEENININNSTVNGEYGQYIFDFHEATILDNGILITNETLSNIGTVTLTNPIFPNSNYFIDLKIYSSEDVGISTLDTSDYIVTEITVPLQRDTAVNIPFETLEMDNIISFNAKIRINHKDLIIRESDKLSLTTIRSPLLTYVPSKLEATYIDADGYAVEGKQIKFYDWETVIGTATTDKNGKAVLNSPFSSMGTYTIRASSGAIFSNTSSVRVTDNADLVFGLTNSNNKFSIGTGDFEYENELQVSYGDNTGEIITPDRYIQHEYSDSESHTVKILGTITKLGRYCFDFVPSLEWIYMPNTITSLGVGCFAICTELNSVVFSNTLTTIEDYCFAGCTSLESISIPSSVQSIGQYCFANCTSLQTIVMYGTQQIGKPIVPYDSSWLYNSNSFEYFSIPKNTTSLYTHRGYPADKLVERP